MVTRTTASISISPSSDGTHPISPQSTPAPPLQALIGEAHKRFVIVTTLLSLIDPVRGEPTPHSLDSHPHDASKPEQLQKKFLDSFALICSTSRKGGDTASAVCLEQGHPHGNVLRLARNLGAPDDLVIKLQRVLGDLTAVALREKTPKQAEPEILLKIIDLTRDKIDAILERFQSPKAQLVIHRAMADLDSSETDSSEEDAPKFREWVSNLPLLVTLPRDSDSASLIAHIKWASQARWIYSGQLETMLETQDLTLPSWLKHIYKLGRYYAATKAMIKLAMKQPDILASIHVEIIQPPAPEPFTIRKDLTALATALKRLTKTDPQALMQKLGQNWLTDDPEARLRRACELRLLVHAEMQLLSFYDHNVDLTPRLLFMGTSKKACYLCHEFISRHPLTIGVSATHNKLYPAWMPAPGNSAVRKKHKVLLWEFSRHLEGTAARDLEMRLGLRRQPVMDSTAGPSLTTTATDVSGNWVHQVSLRAASAGDQASVADVADVEASLGRGLDAILRLHRS